MPPLYVAADAMSLEAPLLDALGDRISECTAAHSLAGYETGTAAERSALTRAKVTVCHQTDPWDDERYISLIQAGELGVMFDLAPPLEAEAGARQKVGDPEGRCPDEGWSTRVRVTRWISEVELADSGVDNCYLFFLDRTSALCRQLLMRVDAEGNYAAPTIWEARREGRPLWCNDDVVETQGLHLWVNLVVDCGSAQSGGSE